MTLGFALNPGTFLPGAAAGVGNDGESRTLVDRVGLARDQAVGFQPIDQPEAQGPLGPTTTKSIL